MIGIKVWIFKGEVFDKAPEVVVEEAAEAAVPAVTPVVAPATGSELPATA